MSETKTQRARRIAGSPVTILCLIWPLASALCWAAGKPFLGVWFVILTVGSVAGLLWAELRPRRR
jgi:hypothetical protein